MKICHFNTSFFSSATLFLVGSAVNLSSPKKICQMKAGQNNKYDITKTLDLVQVWLKMYRFNLFAL
jgi:hypothetical protein